MRRVRKHQAKKSKRSKVKSYKDISTDVKSIWRIFCYFSITIALTFLFSSNAWELINQENISVKGNNYLKEKRIINATEINYPINLLSLNAKQIERNLISNLSLESVSINRLIISKKLIIDVLERDPIAYAKKNGEKGVEDGMIDKNGIWIPFTLKKEELGKEINLEIDGWTEDQREWIAAIILHRNNLGSPLRKIMLSPNGEINLQTQGFELVRLGVNRNQLKEQIKILSHLSKSLPSGFINQPGSTIDLRDPFKPELQTPKEK